MKSLKLCLLMLCLTPCISAPAQEVLVADVLSPYDIFPGSIVVLDEGGQIRRPPTSLTSCSEADPSPLNRRLVTAPTRQLTTVLNAAAAMVFLGASSPLAGSDPQMVVKMILHEVTSDDVEEFRLKQWLAHA